MPKAEQNKFQPPVFSSCHPPALLFPLAVAAGSVFTELTSLLRLVLVASRRIDVVTVVMIISRVVVVDLLEQVYSMYAVVNSNERSFKKRL